MRASCFLIVLAFAGCGGPDTAAGAPPVIATFSIAAFDPETGDLGVAVQSKFFGVGVVVPWVRADVGAVATQALAEPAYGPEGLDLLDDGLAAPDVVARLIAADGGRDRRQVGVVDAQGRAAAWTGKDTFAWSGHVVGEHFCCQGNILAGRDVVQAMAQAFEGAEGPLAERLVKALEAGQAAGGDKRGRQSAALLVARRGGGYRAANDRYIDLRVDDHAEPIRELGRLLALRRGVGRDAPVPERLKPPFTREPRRAADGEEGPRAVWERWRRLRAEQDWDGVYALANAGYREEHSLAELTKSEREQDSPQARAARGTYVGTQITADPPRARLWFALPHERELVMLLLVREGTWKIIP